jgi:hypothetical protein
MYLAMKFSHHSALVIAGMTVSWIAGCGGDTGPKLPDGPKGSAKAKVTCEGKQITVGTLLLDSGKGFTASAPAGKDGTFELKGPTGAQIPAGKYKVAITPPPAPAPAPGVVEMPAPQKIEGVAEKFYNAATSGVEVEIKAGSQDIEIILK